MYRNLRTNLPREVMSYTDFPFTRTWLDSRASAVIRRYAPPQLCKLSWLTDGSIAVQHAATFCWCIPFPTIVHTPSCSEQTGVALLNSCNHSVNPWKQALQTPLICSQESVRS